MAGNLALYRKYRSATFAEVIGQEHVTEPLQDEVRAVRVEGQGAEALVGERLQQIFDRVLVESVSVFDVFAGKNVGEGKKSIAVAVRIQPQLATLTDSEIEALAQKIVTAALKLGATLRS